MGEWDPVDPNADQSKKGWLTAILELGAWLGTLLSSFMAEFLSRKYGVLVATTVFILGVIIQATAVQAGHEVILAGRFITFVSPTCSGRFQQLETNIPIPDIIGAWVSEVWP